MKSFTQDMTLGLETLGEARAWIIDRISCCAVAGQVDLLSAEIAVGEVLQNIVRYAYRGSGPVTLRVSDLDEAVAITVFDEAPPSDPNSWDNEKAPTDGGLGLSVIKNAIDACSFRPLPVGNRASIYFFPNQSGFGSVPLKWAGELLEARAANETISSWIKVCESSGLVEPRVIEALHRCGDALVDQENKQAQIPQYHNTKHFLDVFISAIHWLETQRDSDVIAGMLLVAALMHDYNHPGELPKPQESGQSVESVSTELFRQLFEGSALLNPCEIDLTSDMILDTEPGRVEPFATEWSRLFNALDISASMIPWLGISLTKALVEEQMLGDDVGAVYASFVRSRSEYQISVVGGLLEPWYRLTLERLSDQRLSW